MTSKFARTLVALPLVLMVMTNAAMSQSQGGGGGGGGGAGNGDGGGDGSVVPLVCAVGGACNPQLPPFYKVSQQHTNGDCTEFRRPIPGTGRAEVVYRCPQPN